ncbi:hypothetical protein EBZ80_24505 [bacterium]|nr:hypothetical protein [bacterium]
MRDSRWPALARLVDYLHERQIRIPALRALQILHYGGSFLLVYLTFFSRSPAMLSFIIVLNLFVIFHWYKINACILTLLEDYLRCTPRAPKHPLYDIFFEAVAMLMVLVALFRLRRLCPCPHTKNVKKMRGRN